MGAGWSTGVGWEIDGVLFDVVRFPPPMCLCDFCKRKFKLLHGLELTPGLAAAEPRLFGEFRCKAGEASCGTSAIRSRRTAPKR